MKQPFKKMTLRLLRTGTDGVTDERDVSRIRLVNAICLASMVAISMVAIPLIYLTNWSLAVVLPITAQLITNLGVLFLNKRRQYLAAALMLYSLQCLVVCYYGILLGGFLSIEYAVILLIAVSFLIFDKRRFRNVAVCMALLDFTVLEMSYYWNHSHPAIHLSFDVQYILHVQVMAVIILMTLIVSKPYVTSYDLRGKLERANSFIKMFVAQVTHELRVPLDVIHQIAQMLKIEVERDEDLKKISHLVDMTLAETKMSRNIVNNVLNMSDIEAGKMETLKKGTILVADFFTRIIEGKKVIARVENKQLRLTIDEKMPAAIVTDAFILEGIMTNLIFNAIKYGEKVTAVTIDVRRLNEKGWSIAVTNEGQGIPAERLSSIFDLSYTTGANFVEGTGLGLYIVRHRVQALGGTILATSVPSYRTTFTVTLPLVVGNMANGICLEDIDLSTDLGGIHVLLAEDDKLCRVIMFKSLTDVGCKVTFVQNGLELIQEAEKCRPDIILMDYHMPVMDGMTATRHIKGDPALRHIPVILITGDLYATSDGRILKAGADAYLRRPVDLRALQMTISREITRRRGG
jgi:signal transduction histidine kinase/CheY-like chemotaxis protein